MVNQIQIYREEINKNLIKKNNKELLENYLKMQYFYTNKMYDYIEKYKVLPYKIDIEPVTKCFLKCRYCQVPYWKRNTITDLTFNNFKKIIDALPYLLEVKIQGQGEPLLNSDLFKMVRYSTEKGILTRFNTNGMLLNMENIENIIDSGLFELRLSLDGAYKETNEMMRTGLDFDKVISNLKNIIKVRGNRRLPLINIWTLMTKINHNEMKELVKLCADIGVDGLMIQTKLSTRNDEEIEKRVHNDTINIQNNNIIEELYIEAEKRDFYLEIHKDKWMSQDVQCWWLWNSVYISVDGYVVPCSIINNPECINFGNIFKENFEEIWFGKKYSDFRRKTLNMDINELCKWCYIK